MQIMHIKCISIIALLTEQVRHDAPEMEACWPLTVATGNSFHASMKLLLVSRFVYKHNNILFILELFKLLWNTLLLLL